LGRGPGTMSLELNDWLKDGRQLDEDELKELLDDQFQIQDVYRDYQREADPNYEYYDSADESEHGLGCNCHICLERNEYGYDVTDSEDDGQDEFEDWVERRMTGPSLQD
jgi:hypothetical protein